MAPRRTKQIVNPQTPPSAISPERAWRRPAIRINLSVHKWSPSTSLDPAQYVGFSITAAVSYHLELTSLTFQAGISLNGPTNAEVAMFINGSAVATATFLYSPPTSLPNTPTTFTFDFTDLTAVDNATVVEFRFYGWNSSGPGERLGFDDVTTNGTISNVPEPSTVWAILLPFALILHRLWKRFWPAWFSPRRWP
jgi:hypothetical protein